MERVDLSLPSFRILRSGNGNFAVEAEKRIKEEGREDVKIQPVENRVARQARDRAVEFFITPRRKTKSGRKG